MLRTLKSSACSGRARWTSLLLIEPNPAPGTRNALSRAYGSSKSKRPLEFKQPDVTSHPVKITFKKPDYAKRPDSTTSSKEAFNQAWRTGEREAELIRRGKPLREVWKSALAEAKRYDADISKNAEPEPFSRRFWRFLILFLLVNIGIDFFVEYFLPAYAPVGTIWLWRLWKEQGRDGEAAST